jgi:homoserine kinase
VRLTASVPATSANLGPGFDCFGLALGLVNDVLFDTDAEPGVSWEGEGADELPTDGTDAVSVAMGLFASETGVEVPPGALHGVNRIPLERGLGSSAAASVAGIVLAQAVTGLRLEPVDLLRLAATLEGHPDNAAAAVFGGFTIAYAQGVLRMDAAPDLRPVVLVPEGVRLPTDEARSVLATEVPRADAVYNLQQAALAVVAISARPELLFEALEDRLHQDRRLALVPPVRRMFERLHSSGVPVCVSGAGPSLLAFDLPDRPVPRPGSGWRILRVPVRSAGAVVRRG